MADSPNLATVMTKRNNLTLSLKNSKNVGYHIDVAIAGWAAIKVADFEETETETHGKHCA